MNRRLALALLLIASVVACGKKESNSPAAATPAPVDKPAKQDVPAIAKSNRIRSTAAGIRKDRKITAWRNFADEIVRKPRIRE